MGTCPHIPGLPCPRAACPGIVHRAVCEAVAGRPAPSPAPGQGPAAPTTPRPHGIDPALRDRILTCPARGGVLPVSMQPSCGCRGGEVSECREGRGATPGRVTLADCMACQHR